MEKLVKKYYAQGVITSLVFLQSDIVSLWLKEDRIAENAVPGQFVSLYCGDRSRMLPRPISICETDPEQGIVRLVFRIAGKGTLEFSKLHPGDKIDLAGPLGNGYELSRLTGKKVLIAGGGIGIPPMLGLAKKLKGEIVLGYRDKSTFLLKDFNGLGNIYIATEDGSFGTKGNVIDAIREQGLAAEVICACGPWPMLRGISNYAKEQGIRAFVSLEERMACGIGACLACTCNTKDVDSHSNVKNKRVCKDGPVFNAEDIEWRLT